MEITVYLPTAVIQITNFVDSQEFYMFIMNSLFSFYFEEACGSHNCLLVELSLVEGPNLYLAGELPKSASQYSLSPLS